MAGMAIDREAMLQDAMLKDATGIIKQAFDAWCETDISDIGEASSRETYLIARESFIRGYMRGVQKKITGE